MFDPLAQISSSLTNCQVIKLEGWCKRVSLGLKQFKVYRNMMYL